MPALSARHIASSALCATLLVGITAPTAMAVDSAHKPSRTASSETRRDGADALLAKLRKYNGGELAPVADLMSAVLKADSDRLSAAEVRRLSADAQRALAKVSAGTSAGVLPAPAGNAAGLPSGDLDDLDDLDDLLDDVLDLDDLLDDVLDLGGVLEDLLDAVEELLEAIADGLEDVPDELDDLLSELADLIDDLLDTDLGETISSDVRVSSTQSQTAVAPVSGVALPVKPLTQLLLSAP
jgi:hypothetical protein